jgi:hypothetical protein
MAQDDPVAALQCSDYAGVWLMARKVDANRESTPVRGH